VRSAIAVRVLAWSCAGDLAAAEGRASDAERSLAESRSELQSAEARVRDQNEEVTALRDDLEDLREQVL
jgi:chromosome segregation ATPase